MYFEPKKEDIRKAPEVWESSSKPEKQPGEFSYLFS